MGSLMMNRYFTVLILFILPSLFSCGSKIAPRIAPEQNVQGLKISAVLKNSDESTFAISDITNKPRIFIFASTFCGVCQQEHRNLRDLFAQNGDQRPLNIELYTIMTGAVDSADSLDFMDFTGIQWTPLYQPGDELRNQLCGAGTANPCIVIEMPNQGIVFKHFGEVSIADLQKITGVWAW